MDNRMYEPGQGSRRNAPALTPQMVLGLAILVVGTLVLLDNLRLMNTYRLWNYWPLLLVAIGLARAVEPAGRFGGLLLTGVGLLLMPVSLGWVHVHMLDLWPVVLILVGGGMLWRSLSRDSADRAGEQARLGGMAFMGGFKRTCSSREFVGGELTAVMGGCEVDLRSASIAQKEAVLDVFVMWGGIELRVPPTWRVVVTGIPLLGGMEDKTVPPTDPQAPSLRIRGTAIMGGVEIKN